MPRHKKGNEKRESRGTQYILRLPLFLFVIINKNNLKNHKFGQTSQYEIKYLILCPCVK